MDGEFVIDRDMVIDDVIRLHPESRTVFVKYGMGCLGCLGAVDETIEGGAKMHGINADQLIEELNATVIREEGIA